jgi:ribosome-binding protein aMBF1 (putative translation factor)
MLTGAQIRTARALLEWSPADLSARARVSTLAIRGAEMAEGTPANLHRRNLTAIRCALEEAGVEFSWGARSDPGACLRERRRVL